MKNEPRSGSSSSVRIGRGRRALGADRGSRLVDGADFRVWRDFLSGKEVKHEGCHVLGALAGIELHPVKIPRGDGGEPAIGPGPESDVLGNAQAGVKEGSDTAEGEEVVGEEDDLAVGLGLLSEPLADGVKG